MSDFYTFRTTNDDNYVQRVVDEASPKTNFLLIQDEDKLTGNKGLIVMVRNKITALGALFPELRIGDPTLHEWLVQSLKQSAEKYIGTNDINGDTEKASEEFTSLVIEGNPEGIESARQTIEHQIRHINNILTGRTVQVEVQSF